MPAMVTANFILISHAAESLHPVSAAHAIA